MTERNLSTSDLASRSEPERGDGDQDRHDDSEPLTRELQERPQREPLLVEGEGERFTGRWQEIQAAFVDEPRKSVEEADRLVADLMQHLAARFAGSKDAAIARIESSATAAA